MVGDSGGVRVMVTGWCKGCDGPVFVSPMRHNGVRVASCHRCRVIVSEGVSLVLVDSRHGS